MEPFFFGKSDKPLFGICHPPLGERARSCGVVICHPIGEEYIHGYRALRQLAYQLSRAGFPVLRFDYYGCGDSAGDAREASLQQWLDDVATAIDEIKRRERLSKVCLIGARLGGTLSFMAGLQDNALEAMVLWDPIVNGQSYLDYLMEQQQEWMRERSLEGKSKKRMNGVLEVMGFPINPQLEGDIQRVNLLTAHSCAAKYVLLVDTVQPQSSLELRDRFTALDSKLEYQHISVPRVWGRQPDGNNVVVPQQVLQAIVSWLSRVISA